MKKITINSQQIGASMLATHIDRKIKEELEASYSTDDVTWEITIKVK